MAFESGGLCGKRKPVLTNCGELIAGDGEQPLLCQRGQQEVGPIRAFPAWETKTSAIHWVLRDDEGLHLIAGDGL